MSSQADARRRRKERNRINAANAPGAPLEPVTISTTPAQEREVAPTTEQRAKAAYAKPGEGKGNNAGHWRNLHPDMIGRLHHEGKLSQSQYEAARLWQEIRAAWVAELGTPGYGSCLADNQSGYDAGDGNIAAVRAYTAMRDKIGRVASSVLSIECDKGADRRPSDLVFLRVALNRIGA